MNALDIYDAEERKGVNQMNDISKEMLRFRAKYNLSQTKCAKMAGITVQTWNQVELGQQNPSRLTAEKIYAVIQTQTAEVSE